MDPVDDAHRTLLLDDAAGVGVAVPLSRGPVAKLYATAGVLERLLEDGNLIFILLELDIWP